MHDLIYLLFKTHVKNTINLIDHQNLQRAAIEGTGFVEVLEKTAWSCDNDIHILDMIPLDFKVFASNNQGAAKIVKSCELSEHFKNLDAKLSRRH